MIKSAFAALAAATAIDAPSAVLAGPYVNVETNAGWTGSNYTGATTDLHVGYEGATGSASYYVQAGPSVIAVDGADSSTEFSGKAGLGLSVSEAVGVYGEISFLTDETVDTGYGGKLGVKYAF